MSDELNPQGDEVDYEELRRQMMGSMPMRQPAPATMADSGRKQLIIGPFKAGGCHPYR
jgi:hypothetical protein